ncbi:MAG TPA: aminotransferase class I/II-fold pyridoxal phosphate-dependent enzyme [Kofleriaceae bacterium]
MAEQQEGAHARHRRAREAYDAFAARGLAHDMRKGWPSAAQLDLSSALLGLPGCDDYTTASGQDARQYSGLQGLPELRAIFAPILGVPVEQLVAADNSSLALMHDALVYALLNGVPGGDGPWVREPRRILCPVPGYYWHFALASSCGFELVPVPLTGEGPDLDAVERLVEDPSVKGMWCVPQYSNPSGETYSDETVRRLARMRTAAPDFRLFWDDAYPLHHLTSTPRRVANILEASIQAGHPRRPLIFTSTSKITFAGAGVGFFAGCPDNVRWYLDHAARRSIGPDKLNQLRHVRFLKSEADTRQLMEQHRRCLQLKFEALDEVLHQHLDGEPGVGWTRPEGGYFTLLTVSPGTAARVVELAKGAGLLLSPAGSLHPHGVDPADQLIRLAPSQPSVAEIREIAAGIALCVRLARREAELA